MDAVSDDAAECSRSRSAASASVTALSQYRAQVRGGQGVIAMKTDGERGKLAGVGSSARLHELMIISNFGPRSASTPTRSRARAAAPKVCG